MPVPGQSWPFKLSATAQGDYWDLDRVNQTTDEAEKERLRREIVSGKRRPRKVSFNKMQTPIKRPESDIFSNNGIRKLEKDFWSKKKKISQSKKIIKRII